MKVLGIDTSGYANSIGVVDDDRVLADFTFPAKTDSLEKIVANIDFALKKANLDLEDIQGFGIGRGPGSWTGIRVGVTVAKILAYSTNHPVCGVPTLEVLAYGARNTAALICPIINAVRDTVYAAFYRVKNGTLNKIGDYYVGDLRGLAERVKEPTVFVGNGAKAYRQVISQALGPSGAATEAREGVPKGSVVALLALARLKGGESNNALSLEPLYLKEATARAFLGRYSGSAQAEGQD